MSDALAVVRPPLTETKELVRDLASSTLIPAALKKTPADILLVILTGQELGLAPLQSIRSIHVIDGKPSMSADLMGSLCMRNPACEYLTLTESSDKVATYEAKRRGAPKPVVMSFSAEQAKAAGLTGKGNWAKYPAAMLRARCLSAICRAVFPDAVGGVYDSDSGEIEARPAPAPVNNVRRVDFAPVDAEWTEPDSVSAAAVMSEPTVPPEALTWLAEASTLAELGALTPKIQSAGIGKDASFRAAYAARLAELKAVTK
jgi:hypothetical protein